MATAGAEGGEVEALERGIWTQKRIKMAPKLGLETAKGSKKAEFGPKVEDFNQKLRDVVLNTKFGGV